MPVEKSGAAFSQIRDEVRADLENIRSLARVFFGKIDALSDSGAGNIPDEDRIWITDVFIDKLQEQRVKLRKIIDTLDKTADLSSVEMYIAESINHAHLAAFAGYRVDYVKASDDVRVYLGHFISYTEKLLVEIQGHLWDSEWKGVDKIKPTDFMNTQRVKYINARKHIQKARENLDGNFEDVLYPLRTAIELSIKERFGFAKIHPMLTFLKDADKCGFPLPSYNSLYNIFDEGSNRVHGGMSGTVFELRLMITFVSQFIDALDTYDVPQEKIDEIKKSNAVE